MTPHTRHGTGDGPSRRGESRRRVTTHPSDGPGSVGSQARSDERSGAGRLATVHGARRGASELLGLILAFGIVVSLLALLQVGAVPVWDATEQYEHSQRVAEDLLAVEEASARVVATGVGERPAVETGVAMPNAGPFVRSPPTQGRLATTATANVTVEGAVAEGGAGAFWDGSVRTYETDAVAYDARYSRYGAAPRIVSEAGVMYAHHPNDAGTADDYFAVDRFAVVDGDRITLVTVAGGYASDEPLVDSIELVPLSAGGGATVVRNATPGSLVVTVPSGMDYPTWADLLTEELGPGGSVADLTCVAGGDAGDPQPGVACGTVRLTMADGAYDLVMGRVGFDARNVDQPPAYLTALEGDRSVVPTNGTAVVTVAVRDAYNNPVSGVDLRAENVTPASMGDLSIRADGGLGVTTVASATTGSYATVRTDERGRARFVVAAPPTGAITGPTAVGFDVVVGNHTVPGVMDHRADAARTGRLPVRIHVQNAYPSIGSAPTVGPTGGVGYDATDFRAVVQVLATEDSKLDGSRGQVEYTPINARIVVSVPGEATPRVYTPWPDGDAFDPLAGDVIAENINDPVYPQRAADVPWYWTTPELPAGSRVAVEMTASDPGAPGTRVETGTSVTVAGTDYVQTRQTAHGAVRTSTDSLNVADENIWNFHAGSTDTVAFPDAANEGQASIADVLGDRIDPATGVVTLETGEVVVLYEMTSDATHDQARTRSDPDGNPDYNDVIVFVELRAAT